MDQYERSSTASTSVDNEELQLFLEKGEADQDSTSKRQRGGWSRCSTLHRVYLVLIHVILVVLVGLLWSRLSQGSLPYFEGVSWCEQPRMLMFEPAADNLQHLGRALSSTKFEVCTLLATARYPPSLGLRVLKTMLLGSIY